MRPWLVALHRYVGLALAGFLCLTGLTGALLAWNDPLQAWTDPHLFVASAAPAGTAALDPLVLRDRVAASHPDALVLYVPLSRPDGATFTFYLRAAPGKTLTHDEVFVDPYTGTLLGERKWGDIRQGSKNLMPFIERVHYSLALGDIGLMVFGMAALVWTLDCFVGAWLTLPARARLRDQGRGRSQASTGGAACTTNARRSWLSRWAPAWKLRTRAGAYKVTFDLHRAGGLWLWLVFFMFAWSSVAFNLPTVYEPAMRSVFAHQDITSPLPAAGAPHMRPVLGWADAHATGQRLMAQEAEGHDFRIIEESALQYDPLRGVYAYSVRSDRDVRDHRGLTTVWFDGGTGARLTAWIPTGVAAGDTIRMWLASLHMASVWGWPYKVLVSAMGLAVLVLSATGVMIWHKKRRARR